MSRDPIHSLRHRTPFHDKAGEEVLHEIESHWHAVRGSRSIPSRKDMNSQSLSGALSHSFTLERVTPSVARFRVAGQAIHNLLNMEPRGMPISAAFTPLGRQMLAPLIYDVCEGPELVEVPLIAQRRLGFGQIRARLLLLPLRTPGNAINTIFGALVLDGNAGRRGVRFDFDQESELRTEPIEPVIRTVHEALQEIALPDLEVESLQPKRPALRLVVDNT